MSAVQKRYCSPKVICLNGEWDFKFYPRPSELPEVIDTDTMRFDKLDVPSCWQFRGYARPFYVNMRYQFPYQPPEIPTIEKVGKAFCWIGSDYGIKPRWQDPGEEYNYVGVYRRFFQVEDDLKNHVLSFLGVASCIDVYVNGSFVGYSEGSHNTAEFDISSYIHEGENELAAVVHRWCNGTYLECQDMWWYSGIYRDVTLIARPETGIEDYAVEAGLADDYRQGILTQWITASKEADRAEWMLTDAYGTEIAKGTEALNEGCARIGRMWEMSARGVRRYRRFTG